MTGQYTWIKRPAAEYADSFFVHGLPQHQTLHVLLDTYEHECVWVYTGKDGQRYYDWVADADAHGRENGWGSAPLPDNWRETLIIFATMLNL